MSSQEERQQPAVTPKPRPGRLHLWAIGILTLLLLVQVAAQLLFADRTITDAEQVRALQGLKLDTGAQAAGTDWPQWRGPNRDGASTETDLLRTWPEGGPRKLWEQPVGAGYSSVAVAGGRAFTLMQAGDNEAVVCWDARTGQELWRFRYAADYKNPYGDGPRSTPTVAGDLVYTVGGTGILHCLKTQPGSTDGEVVWRKDLLEEFGAANLKWGVSFSPLVEGDLVYTNPGGPDGNSLAAFDKYTGALRWKNLDDPAGYSSPIAAACGGVPQIIFFTGAGLVGIAPADGKLLWRFPWETSYGCNIATAIAVQDYVFLSSGYNRGCAVVHVEKQPPLSSDAGERDEGDLQARRVYENKRMCNHFPSSVFHKGFLYGFNESFLTCMEFKTGVVRWRQRNFGKGSLLIAGDRLIVLGEQGKLALADADPAEYRELASCQLPERRYWTVPALASGLLYVRDESRVICLDLRR
jgi:outer membrane protein assembly factor BamB